MVNKLISFGLVFITWSPTVNLVSPRGCQTAFLCRCRDLCIKGRDCLWVVEHFFISGIILTIMRKFVFLSYDLYFPLVSGIWGLGWNAWSVLLHFSRWIFLVKNIVTRPTLVIGNVLLNFPVKSEINFLTDHDWKNDFFVECLSPILEAMTNTARPPDYTYILGLDKSVRDFAVPSLLEEQNTKATPRFLIMQRGLVVMGREIGLFLLSFLVRLFYIWSGGCSAAATSQTIFYPSYE